MCMFMSIGNAHICLCVCGRQRSWVWFLKSLVLIQDLLLSPEACLLGKAGWPVSPKDPPASAFSALSIHYVAWACLHGFQGSKSSLGTELSPQPYSIFLGIKMSPDIWAIMLYPSKRQFVKRLEEIKVAKGIIFFKKTDKFSSNSQLGGGNLFIYLFIFVSCSPDWLQILCN